MLHTRKFEWIISFLSNVSTFFKYAFVVFGESKRKLRKYGLWRYCMRFCQNHCPVWHSWRMQALGPSFLHQSKKKYLVEETDQLKFGSFGLSLEHRSSDFGGCLYFWWSHSQLKRVYRWEWWISDGLRRKCTWQEWIWQRCGKMFVDSLMVICAMADLIRKLTSIGETIGECLWA